VEDPEFSHGNSEFKENSKDKQRQYPSRFGSAFTPAFGRVEKCFGLAWMSRLKPEPISEASATAGTKATADSSASLRNDNLKAVEWRSKGQAKAEADPSLRSRMTISWVWLTFLGVADNPWGADDISSWGADDISWGG
jgi:hypothetical protein